MVEKSLRVATHSQPDQYWEGGHYELNLSFDNLREKQWERALKLVWGSSGITGPLTWRYVPGIELPETAKVQVPPPTATMTQYGQLQIGRVTVGFDLQMTRSLFECISILIPISMFEGIESGPQLRQDHPEMDALDSILCNLALRLYDEVGFKIAAIGYERECQLPVELRSDPELCQTFLAAGNAFVQEDVLRILKPESNTYKLVKNDLYWFPIAS